MLSRENDPFFIEMEKAQKFKDDNIIETLIQMGFSELAMEILAEDYKVKISEYKDHVLIDTDVSKHSFGDNYYAGFNELGFFMIKKDVRFLNETSSFQLRIEDFLELSVELVKEVEE